MDRNSESLRGFLCKNYEGPNLFGLSSKPIPYEKYLTVEDVMRVTGSRGVRQVPFHPQEFLGSDLNFVNGQGEKILCVTFSRASLYDTYRSVAPMNFKAPVTGVGEEAFIGPDIEGREPFMLVFRKGSQAVSLTTAETRQANKYMLTVKELIAIGAIIASRLEEE